MDKKIIQVLDEIMDNFDFDRVKQTMDALDWTWCWVGEENVAQARRGPTVDEIKQTAADLLWNLAVDPDPENTFRAIGGFRAERDFSDPENPWMRLSFEVTDWDACVFDED